MRTGFFKNEITKVQPKQQSKIIFQKKKKIPGLGNRNAIDTISNFEKKEIKINRKNSEFSNSNNGKVNADIDNDNGGQLAKPKFF